MSIQTKQASNIKAIFYLSLLRDIKNDRKSSTRMKLKIRAQVYNIH